MFESVGSIAIGRLAGFIAGKIIRGGGLGFWMNLLLGIVGGTASGWALSLSNISRGGTIGFLGTAVTGAVLLLWIASLFRKS